MTVVLVPFVSVLSDSVLIISTSMDITISALSVSVKPLQESTPTLVKTDHYFCRGFNVLQDVRINQV